MPRKRMQVLGVDLNRSESYQSPQSLRSLPLSDTTGWNGVTFKPRFVLRLAKPRLVIEFAREYQHEREIHACQGNLAVDRVGVANRDDVRGRAALAAFVGQRYSPSTQAIRAA